jgi:hypothetical protein
MSRADDVERALETVNALVFANPQVRVPVTERLGALVQELSHPGAPNSMSGFWVLRSIANQERSRVVARLTNFHSKSSSAWAEITKRFGSSLNQTELLSIAEVIGWKLGIRVDREAKRRKEVLVKWFEEHWAEIADIVSTIRLEDSHGNPIGPSGLP